jgi:hypothetical protein
MFENRPLRSIFGPNREEVAGGSGRLHNEEVAKYYCGVQIKEVARMGEMRNSYKILVGKTEGKRPLGRSRRRWEDNITMDLRKIGRNLWTGFI